MSHADSLSDLSLQNIKKCGIRTVYTLLDGDRDIVYIDSDVDVDKRGDSKVDVISVLSLIGTVAPGQRQFTNEQEMKAQYVKEKRVVETQQRLQLIGGVYEKLLLQREGER